MKNALFLILLMACLDVSAQSVFSNHTNAAIEKVIQDYPNQFRNIKGERLVHHQQTADYQSSIQIPGSLSCIITSYRSSNKDALCWRAELFESADFQNARARYKDLYNQIKNSIIRIEGEKPYILNGQYEIPAEHKRIHSIVFNMLPSVGEMQKLKVELSLVQQASSWKIALIVHDQPRIDLAASE